MVKDIVKTANDDKELQNITLDNANNNPFKSDPPAQEETPEEAAEAEQKRKEALTERD